MTDDAIEMIREWCSFGEYRAYILMAIARSTHNDEISSNSEIVHRRVITNEGEIADAVHDLDWLTARHGGLAFRLYRFFKARIPPFTAGVKPTTASHSTVGCRPNTP